MKNIAKILCFVLSLVLVISAMGVITFADETTVAEVDGVYYTDLVTAFKAAKENSVINILDDVTISDNWDNRKTGAKFTVPVTINGNGHTLKFTGTVNDSNYFSVFRFEKAATVTNLTIDLSEATNSNNRVRGISAKLDLTVDGCTFIGNTALTNTRGIIFGEGAGQSVGTVNVSITNCEFSNFRRAIVDNENGQDVKSVVITGNECTNASVYVSASNSVVFNNNVMVGGYVNVKSYSGNNLTVDAKDNTLETAVENGNVINACYVNGGEGFAVAPKGNLTSAFTGATSIWGECGGNAKESFVIKVYSGDELLYTASLNNVDGIIDGSVYVTWSVDLAGNSSDYWTVDLFITAKDWIQPTKVEQWVDGVMVAEAPIQLNGPDGVNKIVAATVDEYGQIIKYYTSLATAMAESIDGRVLLLADVNESIGSFTNIYLYTYAESGVTINSTYIKNYVDFDNATIGSNITLNVKDLYSGGSLNNVEGTLNVSSNYYLGYDAITNVSGALTVAGEFTFDNNDGTDPYTGNLNLYGAFTCGTLNLVSGNIFGYWADVKCDNFVANVPYGVVVSIEESTIAINNVSINAELDFKAVDNGDGTFGLVTKHYVAELNGKKYESLQEAINAAGYGDTVYVIDNIDAVVLPTADSVNNADNCFLFIAADKTVVLDLNGYTISVRGDDEAKYDVFAVRNYGTLTITDSSWEQSGKITLAFDGTQEVGSSQIHSTILNFGTLTIEAGTIENTATTGRSRYPIHNYSWGGNAILTIKGGIFVGPSCAIYAAAYDDFQKYVCEVYIEGGVFEGGIWYADQGYSAGATISISGGTFNQASNPALTIKGSATTNVSVTGGTFNGEVNASAAIPGFISGGLFATDVADYLVEGYKTVEMSDGYYGIGEATGTPVIIDGYWWIGGINTGYKAVPSITVDENGYWVINGLPTDFRATAENGASSKVAIGEDGYWYINDVKTDVVAQAIDGVGIVKIEKDEELSDKYSTSYVIYLTSGEKITFSVNNGLDGNQGETGDMGEVGNMGKPGDQGAPGLDGYDGSDVVVTSIVIGGVCALLALIVLGFRVFKRDPFAL